MKKKNTTKKALVSSLLALTLSSSMLVGTTFAWFTDSVTSTGNVIQTGTLDVGMYWAEGSKAVPADDSTDWKDAEKGAIFDYKNWEPGYAQARHLRIANEGSLALKYQLTIVPNGTVSALANVIDVYYFETAEQLDRDALTADKKLGTLAQVIDKANANSISKKVSGNLESDKDKEITIVFKMQESAGNEYQNMSLGADFSVQLLATQLAYEKDSFDNEYDEITLVSNAEELTDAITAGEDVMLTGDVALDADTTITVADDADILLDLNGYEINGTASTSGKNRQLFTVKGEMSVIGEGTVSMVYTGTNMGWNNLSAPFSVEGGTLTLGEGVNVMNFGGTDMAYAVDVNTTLGETVLNVNGATLYSTYIGVRIFNNHSTAKGTVNYNDGIIYGAKNGYDIWAQLMSEPAENAVVNIAGGISYTTEDKSGTMYYIADEMALVSTPEALGEAIANSDSITLTSDVDLGSTTLAVASDKEVTLDLNGKTITYASDDPTATCAIDNKGTLTIKNGTVVSLAENPDTDWNPEGFPTYASNTISNSGTLIIEEGTVIENQTNVGGASYAIDNYAGATLTVNGGTILAKDVAIRMNTATANKPNTVTINGGTITGKRAVWIHLAGSNESVVPIVNLTIKGGDLTGTSGLAIYSYSYGNSFANTNVTIEGGTFNGDVAFGGGYKGDRETVTVTGGIFTGYLGRYLADDGWEDIAKPNV